MANFSQRTKSKGVTLVLVTVIGIIVVILSLTMIQLGYHARVMAARTVHGILARCAADAGMANAIFLMNKKLIDEATWDNSSLPSSADVVLLGDMPPPFSRFSYSVTGDSGAGFQITSTGICGMTTQKQVHTTLEIGSYFRGIGVEEEVNVKLGTTFDTIGPGLPSDLEIRSNTTDRGAMIFKAFVTVPGDVVCGPGGDPAEVIDCKATTVIEGETYAASETLVFPDVPVPDNMVYSGSITDPCTVISTPGRYQYDTINVPQSGILKIATSCVIYVTGPMILNQGSEVIVQSGASLELYLGVRLEDKNSIGMTNETLDARCLRIYGLPTCTDIDLKAKSDLHAAVYAPDADLDLFNAGDIYGAFVAESFEMKNSATFYYDTNLKSLGIDDPAALFIVGRWWED